VRQRERVGSREMPTERVAESERGRDSAEQRFRETERLRE
jgi:hypothetical protein